MEPVFLQAVHDCPEDESSWLALADWLEEAGQADRAELLRLRRGRRGTLRPARRRSVEARVRALLGSGVRPCVPGVVNSIGMRLVLFLPGTFRMGCARGEPHADPDERPPHEV